MKQYVRNIVCKKKHFLVPNDNFQFTETINDRFYSRVPTNWRQSAVHLMSLETDGYSPAAAGVGSH